MGSRSSHRLRLYTGYLQEDGTACGMVVFKLRNNDGVFTLETLTFKEQAAELNLSRWY